VHTEILFTSLENFSAPVCVTASGLSKNATMKCLSSASGMKSVAEEITLIDQWKASVNV
jgi:hypothetical protein